MRLGGWWRLWIVLAALYGIAVVAVFASDWPSAERIQHGPWLTYRLSAESQRLLKTPSPSMADLEAALVQADKAGDADRARSLARQIVLGREKPWALAPFVAEGPNGHSFDLPASTTKEQVSAFIRDYARVLTAEASDRRSRAVKVFVFALLVPPVLLLLLGLAVTWVRRGFQRDRGAP